MKALSAQSTGRLLGVFTLAGLLFLPLLVYLWAFGTELSRDHTRWGEFGSAISGIYTPLLAALTLYVIVVQARLQAEAHSHEKDRAYIEQVRVDMEFYIVRIDEMLARKFDRLGGTFKHSLLANFARIESDDFSAGWLLNSAQALNSSTPQVLQLLFAINAIFAGLSASDRAQYRVNYTAARQKMAAVLGFETCVALDHFHAVITEGRVRVNYFFSPKLSPEQEILSSPAAPAEFSAHPVR